MTNFPGKTPLLSMLLLVCSQLPAQNKTSPTGDTDQIKASNLKHFMIENVYAEKIGATLIDFKISPLSFEIDAGKTTKNPQRVYSALVKLSQDTLDTVEMGVASYPDGNMTKLLADQKEFETCHWQGFEAGTQVSLGKPDPAFDRNAYAILDDIIEFKSAGLLDGDDLFDLLEKGQQDALIQMAQDSYVDAAKPKPELEQAVRAQTRYNAVEYANTLYRLWLADDAVVTNGLAHEDKGENGLPKMLNAINAGKAYVAQLGILGAQAAQRVSLGIVAPPKASLAEPSQ